MSRVEGKAAIVTGGARGQGEAHVRLLAREGARVLIGDVLDELGGDLAEELQRAGHEVQYLHLDVSDEASWADAARAANSRWGKIDALVNNAGILGSRKTPTDETMSEWERVVAVNQRGVWLGMKTCVPYMRECGGGSIVNIASIHGGIVGAPGFFSYQATKGAVTAMSRTAALDYAADNIRVNSICPGLVMTAMAAEDSDEDNAAFMAATPLGRGARPEEISWGVLFLISDEASYVTGTELAIDGGFTCP